MQRNRPRWTSLAVLCLLLLAAAAASAVQVADLDEGKRISVEKDMPLVLEFGAKW